MTPEQWRRVRVLFDVAGGLPDHQRAAFLRNACAEEPGLRQEVESLLRSAAQAGEFLESGPLQDLTLPHDLAAGLGAQRTHIGPYEVLRELGRGGMGTVYLGRRSDGSFQQEVAIKLVRPGMGDEAVLRRFVAERQILAGLAHPFIARLYDGGTTEDGLPYFVMEYVEGEDLLSACDRRRLSVTDRLRLFEKVCAAVQYAHQRLVVHRDLKPSNILVMADGTPRLLDFGIAKLLAADGAEEGAGDLPAAASRRPTDPTSLAVRLMTPEYASPEQVRGEPVTTATDVYSLGVLLYELLTGHRPYQLASRRPEEVERVIRDTAPLRPSTVVRRPVERPGEGEPTRLTPEVISAARDGTPARLQRSLAGDLDNIVLTALRKEPERRYASVEKLAEDLRRHLAGLPVSARPDTFAYRTGKLLRRHALAAATTALAILAIGLLTTYYTVRLARERDHARLEAAKAQRVSAFLGSLFELSDLDRTKGVKLSLRDVVDRGAATLPHELSGEPEVAATMMDLIGNVYVQLDLKDQALPLLTRALEIRRRLFGDDHHEVAAIELDLAPVLHELGQDRQAEGLLRHALAVLEREPGKETEVAATLTLLAEIYKTLGDYGAVRTTLDRAVAQLERAGPPAELELARALTSKGHFLNSVDDGAGALPLFRRALAIHERLLGPQSPGAAASLLDLAAAERETGELDAAIAADERVLAIAERAFGPDHSLAAYAAGELGMAWTAKGDAEEAAPWFERAIRYFTVFAGPESHEALLYRRAYGSMLVGSGKPRAGLAELEAVLAGYQRRLGPDHPRVGSTWIEVARARLLLGESGEAERALRSGIEVLRRQRHPDSGRLGEGLSSLGALLCGGDRGSEGASLLREAVALLHGARPASDPNLAQAETALRRCVPGSTAAR